MGNSLAGNDRAVLSVKNGGFWHVIDIGCQKPVSFNTFFESSRVILLENETSFTTKTKESGSKKCLIWGFCEY